jgi:hypothetical protein
MRPLKTGRKRRDRFTDLEVKDIHEIIDSMGLSVTALAHHMEFDRCQLSRILTPNSEKRRGVPDKAMFIELFFSIIESLKEGNND